MRALALGVLVTAASAGGWTSAALGQTLRPTEVRFDALNVVRDREGNPSERIGEFDAACPVPRDRVQWKDCERFPDARTEKNWPIVAAGGTRLTIDHVVIAVRRPRGSRPLRDARVVGTASFGGPRGVRRTLRWSTRATIDERDGRLRTGPMVSDRTLPRRVGRMITIRWRVVDGDRTHRVRNSTHPLYVTYGKPTGTPYLSLVDLTTRVADGETTKAGVFDAIWFAFEARAMSPRVLDPVTGAVTVDRDVLQYWTPWTLLDDYLFLGGTKTCGPNAGTAGILQTRVGRCGSWAQFFRDTLGVQGLAAAPHGVDDYPGFPTGPAGAEIMLIKSWTFSGSPRPGADPAFPYQTQIDFPAAGGRRFGALRQVDDVPGAAGQGRVLVPNPPGWFVVGDHAVATYEGKIFDPSYGSGPFADIRAWARASLAGYARLTVASFGPETPGGARRTVTIHASRGVP